MLVKDLYILKKPYVAPLVEFEELDEDLMDDAEQGSVTPGEDDESDEDPFKTPSSLDLDFSMDFVVNEESEL